ncbi:hypothetical protein LEP1GSC133_0270 [Leptospira borgpetersenii serovar Pomona str. 200901868]|uniref:Uncharacterized protein n=1 Tax=Leptospira borgpetersenii serovar Pomona str. 200901868 TaxID=1192866 RepID=M6W7V5_LEPBO|nr:hypothetical protein LEP1GSC133_0270 [Leptospira borgpetersenii serovar Pomona str. 200901868]
MFYKYGFHFIKTKFIGSVPESNLGSSPFRMPIAIFLLIL